MRVNLKIVIQGLGLLAVLVCPQFVHGAVGFGLGLGPVNLGFNPANESESERKLAPTGLASGAYLRGSGGWRLISDNDAPPYYDRGSYYSIGDLQSKQGWTGNVGVGYLFRKGLSFEAGWQVGPSREFSGDVIYDPADLIVTEDYRIKMSVSTFYVAPEVHWLLPVGKHYFLLSLGGRMGLATMHGEVSFIDHSGFLYGDPPQESGHKVRATTFSQAYLGRARYFVTPTLSLDLELSFETQVFEPIEVSEGWGGLEGYTGFDVTGTRELMSWDFSGPAFRFGLTWFFKTPMAVLRAPKMRKLASDRAQSESEAQRRAADALFKARLFEQARDSYRGALVKDSANARAWYGLGMSFYQLSDLSNALQAFEKALELSPANPKMEEFVGKLRRHLERTLPVPR